MNKLRRIIGISILSLSISLAACTSTEEDRKIPPDDCGPWNACVTAPLGLKWGWDLQRVRSVIDSLEYKSFESNGTQFTVYDVLLDDNKGKLQFDKIEFLFCENKFYGLTANHVIGWEFNKEPNLDRILNLRSNMFKLDRRGEELEELEQKEGEKLISWIDRSNSIKSNLISKRKRIKYGEYNYHWEDENREYLSFHFVYVPIYELVRDYGCGSFKYPSP